MFNLYFKYLNKYSLFCLTFEFSRKYMSSNLGRSRLSKRDRNMQKVMGFSADPNYIKIRLFK